jgi:hypothetical protein
MDKCLTCKVDLTADNITDNIPYCHTCYCQRNPEVFRYLKKLENWGSAK